LTGTAGEREHRRDGREKGLWMVQEEGCDEPGGCAGDAQLQDQQARGVQQLEPSAQPERLMTGLVGQPGQTGVEGADRARGTAA
jgi:hypothetical protein